MLPDALLFDLTNSLQPVRRAWMKVASTVMADLQLSTSLGTVIILISRLGPAVPQKELALEVGVNPAALVRTLDQGESAELLKRDAVAGDRRSNTVSLLPPGKVLAEAIEQRLVELRRALLDDLAAKDVETAQRVLRTLEMRAQNHLQRGDA
ncbi:MarR family transcriptional regulator [Aurantiacibacter atlanticus]|uniref:MarR family transcriptional regulator n=1 Tax=Aurantiacibacter atlanticus TaxID=1648404 RepID=A0A0H4VKG6_9SPHN|nr:hypothetical protein [Aurantiacibacter atlanticus]AKQ43494.2 MarR family transcriptional regulator [Aurantiacibacter atlanticus]MDF1834335.1 MarR family transcriptional regulator [Alteraurantiacibacter sp. bin_em_oilr2.035]